MHDSTVIAQPYCVVSQKINFTYQKMPLEEESEVGKFKLAPPSKIDFYKVLRKMFLDPNSFRFPFHLPLEHEMHMF